MVKRIANALLTVELAVLIAFGAMCFGGIPFGYQCYGVLTGSMEPTIPTGALAYVDTGVTGDEVSLGDVVAFDIGDGRTCTHRVVAVDAERGQVTTKGDANANPDAFPVSFEQIRGRTVFAVPYAGDVLLGITEHRGAWAAGVAAVIALTFALTCVPDKREKQSERNENGREHDEQAAVQD